MVFMAWTSWLECLESCMHTAQTGVLQTMQYIDKHSSSCSLQTISLFLILFLRATLPTVGSSRLCLANGPLDGWQFSRHESQYSTSHCSHRTVALAAGSHTHSWHLGTMCLSSPYRSTMFRMVLYLGRLWAPLSSK